MEESLFKGAGSLDLELLCISGCKSTVTEQRLHEVLKELFPACKPVIIGQGELSTALRTLGFPPEKFRVMLDQDQDASCTVTAAIVQRQEAVPEYRNKVRAGESRQAELHKISTLMNVTAAIERLEYEQEQRESKLKRLAGIEEEKLSALRTLARNERELQERLAILSRIAQHYESLAVHDETLEAFQRVQSEAELFEEQASDLD